MAKMMGIDYGAKRVGIAMSDDTAILAFPYQTFQNTKDLIEDITTLCMEEQITSIVVGESKTYAGKENDIMEQVRSFVAELKEKGFMVHLQQEFFTSVEADKIVEEGERDAKAAALILQRFLDTQNEHK